MKAFPLRVMLAQLNYKVADFEGNTEKIIKAINKAKEEKQELVVFSELALWGYPTRDRLLDADLIEKSKFFLNKIQNVTVGITVVLGCVEKNENQTGKPYYNSAVVFQNGGLLGFYRKQLLPYYGIFEEERYFESGDSSFTFDCNRKKVGVTICEDVWNQKNFILRTYDVNPLNSVGAVDLLVNLSASPFEKDKIEKRILLFSSVAKKLKVPLVVCNQVGANDELLFDGSSFMMDETGCLVAQAKSFEEATLSDKEPLNTAMRKPEETLFQALVMGVRDYIHKSNLKSVCIGLSGGIDSSVVAVIAKEALGASQVYGVALPSQFTEMVSNKEAKVLAENLGITLEVLPIEPIYQKFNETLSPVISVDGLTSENIQPRIRMTLLMAISNARGSVLLNTSNKSEIATGYATLYGDSAGAISVIGDLTKREVYSLANWINRNSEIIPKAIIQRPPSAELRPNQKDEDSLPPYSILDEIVENHIADGIPLSALNKIEKQYLELFERLYRQSEYKRHQLPPALRVSHRAFGMGRRMPIVSL